MLDANLKAQLKSYLERVTQPIEIVASLDDGAKSREMHDLLKEITSLSSQITLLDNGNDARKPSFSLNRPGGDISLRFAGIPMGHEFTSLVLALLQVGGHPSKASAEVIEQIRSLKGEFNFETYFSLSCQNCPDVVQALNLMAVLNPNIRHVAIDGALFQDEVTERQVMAVPSVYLNGVNFGQGRMGLEEILGKLDTSAIERQAEKISAKEAFDVLVIGGGPAGAAAAIYAARKGIRTGVAAERFGGQVLDTMAIENFISVQETEGPKLATALEEHVKQYDVDIMNLQRADKLLPGKAGELHEVKFASGASLKAKTVILATGARWREMNVPGEQEYRSRGVGDGGNTILLANSYWSDFNAKDERSWQLGYGFDFGAVGIPGLTYNIAYVRGTNIDDGSDRGRGTEREIFNQAKYVVQSGPVKDLSVRLRGSWLRVSNNASDYNVGGNEVRVFVDYPISIF